jgi:hypothetical protein
MTPPIVRGRACNNRMVVAATCPHPGGDAARVGATAKAAAPMGAVLGAEACRCRNVLPP